MKKNYERRGKPVKDGSLGNVYIKAEELKKGDLVYVIWNRGMGEMPVRVNKIVDIGEKIAVHGKTEASPPYDGISWTLRRLKKSRVKVRGDRKEQLMQIGKNEMEAENYIKWENSRFRKYYGVIDMNTMKYRLYRTNDLKVIDKLENKTNLKITEGGYDELVDCYKDLKKMYFDNNLSSVKGDLLINKNEAVKYINEEIKYLNIEKEDVKPMVCYFALKNDNEKFINETLSGIGGRLVKAIDYEDLSNYRNDCMSVCKKIYENGNGEKTYILEKRGFEEYDKKLNKVEKHVKVFCFKEDFNSKSADMFLSQYENMEREKERERKNGKVSQNKQKQKQKVKI